MYPSLKWEEIIEEFCLDITIKGMAKNTIVNYRCKLGNLGDYFIERGIEPLLLKKSDVGRLILHLKENNYQHSTINIMINRLKKLFDYMVFEGYLDENPVKFKQLPVNQKIIYPLNDNEIKQVIAVTRKHPYELLAHRNTVIIMLMVDCGLRVSEVAGLRNSDVLRDQILVRDTKYNHDRAVALSPVLKKEIIKYQRVKKRKYRFGQEPEDPLIVSNQNGGVSEKIVDEILRKIMKKVKIRSEVRFSAHTFRHTYASMQMRNGLDIYTLSLNLGHRNVSTTQRYLRTLSSEDFIQKSLKTSTMMNLK